MRADHVFVFLIMYMYVWVCAHESNCTWRAEEGIRSPEAGVIGINDLVNMGTGTELGSAIETMAHSTDH